MLQDRHFGLAVAQMGAVSIDDSRQRVVARLVEMLREAAGRGADLVVFPETALTTFFPRYWMNEEDAVTRYFERDMPNGDVLPLFEAARDLGVGFYLGYAEVTPEGRRFNTAILVDGDAKIIGKYRKIHLPGHSEHKPDAPFQHLEKKYFEVGDLGIPVFETLDAKIGMCLCNDRRWPETWRVMALQSAEIGVVGYNTPSWNIHWNEPPHLRMHTHLVSLQAAAYQNGMWIGAAAKCGFEDGFHMIGGSVIVAPSAEIVAQALTEEDEVIFSKVNLTWGENIRKHVFNFAKHRQPDNYRMIVDRVGAGDPLPQANSRLR